MGNKSFPGKIKNILLGVFEMKVTHAEIAELVKISRIVITSFLINTRSSTVRLCQLHGLTLTDLSYDCIAEIFEKDESGNFRILQNLFTSFHVPLKKLPEIEVFFAYKKLLIKIAEVQIANMYSEYNHPELSYVTLKIYDMLGRKILTLSSESLSMGNYSKYLDAENIPSGV